MKRFVAKQIFAWWLINAFVAATAAAQTAAPDQTRKSKGKSYIFSSPSAKKNQTAAKDKINRSAESAANAEASSTNNALNDEAAAANQAANPNRAAETTSATNDERAASAAQTSQPDVLETNNQTAGESALISVGLALAPTSSKAVEIASANVNPSEIYRVGNGDVLDVRLGNVGSKNSTLFTVLENGLLDYPLAGEPVLVGGLTTEEIADLLRAKITLYKQPELLVAVREYASHKVTLSGLIENPGVKALRREAVPLYALLAEAVQQTAARKVVVRRAGQPAQTIDLKNLNHDFLIRANDFIEVAADRVEQSTPQYYFIAGAIAAGGQKEFHTGLTLTQAIFAAGGTTHKSANKITVLRQNTEGLLISSEFNLKEIKNGKVADPALRSGDRIEIAQ